MQYSETVEPRDKTDAIEKKRKAAISDVGRNSNAPEPLGWFSAHFGEYLNRVAAANAKVLVRTRDAFQKSH